MRMMSNAGPASADPTYMTENKGHEMCDGACLAGDEDMWWVCEDLGVKSSILSSSESELTSNGTVIPLYTV